MADTDDTSADEVDDNLVRDLYLFFELFCYKCGAHWEPANPNEGLSGAGEVWAEQFSQKFGAVAQSLGWGSEAGNVICPACRRAA
jgi:hypothetical protein